MARGDRKRSLNDGQLSPTVAAYVYFLPLKPAASASTSASSSTSALQPSPRSLHGCCSGDGAAPHSASSLEAVLGWALGLLRSARVYEADAAAQVD